MFSQTYMVSYEELFTLDYYRFEDLKKDLKNKKTGFESTTASVLICKDGNTYYGKGGLGKEIFFEEKNTSEEMTSNTIIVGEFYKNRSKNLSIEYLKNYDPLLYGEDIIIKDELPNYNWEITDLKENISGYPCKLAKAEDYMGRSILAWFTDEIPISEGPRHYWGLPGLILQVQINDKVLIKATAIKKISDELEIKFPEKGNEMSRKEFDDFERELSEPRKIIKPDGTIIFVE